MKASSSNNSSPLIKLATLGIVAIGFFYLSEGVGKGATWINELPVEGTVFSAVPDVTPTRAVAPSVASIHPLLVESSKKATGLRGEPSKEVSTGMVTLDRLFGRAPVPELAQKVVRVNVARFDFNDLKNSVRLQATATDGAVINSVYYSVGEKVESAGYAASVGSTLQYPVLVSVSKDSATIAEAGKRGHRLTLQLP